MDPQLLTSMWNDGWNIIPATISGEWLVSPELYMQPTCDRFSLDSLLEVTGDPNIAFHAVLASSLNGDLAVTCFRKESYASEAIKAAGRQGKAMPCCSWPEFPEDWGYRVFWLIDDNDAWSLGEETDLGMYWSRNHRISYGQTTVPLPPARASKWIQPPITDHSQPSRNNLVYFDPHETHLVPALF